MVTFLRLRASRFGLARRSVARARAQGRGPGPEVSIAGPIPEAPERPRVGGKFVYARGEKLYVRGVTYGTFCPGDDGSPYPPPATVSEDFARIAAADMNAIRTYTPPPLWLLDAAAEHGLVVMVGIPWEQHVTF